MKLEHYKFVTEYLHRNDKALAYKNAYNSDSNYNTLESAANRLLKNPEVAEAINNAQAAIRSKVEAEVAEQLKGELLTIKKKRELLYDIATGQMWVEQSYKGKDCNVCTQYVRPTINQMLRAIHLDNKLAGHYPTQQKPEPIHSTSLPDAAPQPKERSTVKIHNKTQQNKTHRKTITQQNLEELLNTGTTALKTPRIFSTRQKVVLE